MCDRKFVLCLFGQCSYDKKMRQGSPAKRWRDDLDKYWSDTSWQMIAQYRLTWRRDDEAFAQPRVTIAAH